MILLPHVPAVFMTSLTDCWAQHDNTNGRAWRNVLAANFNKQDEVNSSKELSCVHVLAYDRAFPVRFPFKWMIACRVWRMFWADIREHCSRSNHTKNGEVGKEIRGAVQSLLPARELCEFVSVPIQLAKFSEGWAQSECRWLQALLLSGLCSWWPLRAAVSRIDRWMERPPTAVAFYWIDRPTPSPHSQSCLWLIWDQLCL